MGRFIAQFIGICYYRTNKITLFPKVGKIISCILFEKKEIEIFNSSNRSQKGHHALVFNKI